MPGGGQNFWTRNAVLHLWETATDATPEKEAETRDKKAFKCDQCDSNFNSENGLKIHVGKSHKQHLIAQDNSKGTPQVTLQFSWQTYWITNDWNNFIFVNVQSWLLWYFLFAAISSDTTADKAFEVYHLRLSLKYTVNIYDIYMKSSATC